MAVIRAAAFLPIILLCAAAPVKAGLLDGHYQIVNLTYVQNDDGNQRGFNNTGLYISASDRRIRIVGAFRGFPIARNMIVDRTVGDTLVLRDADNPSSVYKFSVRNNVITGRHRLAFDDGNQHIIDARATIRKLNRGEVDRLRSILNF
jgi:hypothetical protein